MGDDPPPDEIARRAEAIRAGWSEEYAEARRLGCLPCHLEWALAVIYDKPVHDPRGYRTAQAAG